MSELQSRRKFVFERLRALHARPLVDHTRESLALWHNLSHELLHVLPVSSFMREQYRKFCIPDTLDRAAKAIAEPLQGPIDFARQIAPYAMTGRYGRVVTVSAVDPSEPDRTPIFDHDVADWDGLRDHTTGDTPT